MDDHVLFFYFVILTQLTCYDEICLFEKFGHASAITGDGIVPGDVSS